jgi:hypothetical protein
MPRTSTVLIVLAVISSSAAGCQRQPRTALAPPKDLPRDTSTLHPWIRALLSETRPGVEQQIKERWGVAREPSICFLRDVLLEFVPRNIEFKDGVGYVLCLRNATLDDQSIDVGNVFYVCQPLTDSELDSTVAFFDPEVRPIAREFFAMFAGCGEETPQIAGQFCGADILLARDFVYENTLHAADWQTARVLYHSRFGDAVLITPNGKTGWFVMDQNRIVDLLPDLASFITFYARFRKYTSDVFDYYRSTEFLHDSDQADHQHGAGL